MKSYCFFEFKTQTSQNVCMQCYLSGLKPQKIQLLSCDLMVLLPSSAAPQRHNAAIKDLPWC